MKRMLLVLAAAALTASMMVVIAMPAFAAPNIHSCPGQYNKINNELGFTPHDQATIQPGFSNAGEWEKFLRSPVVACPPP